MRGTPLTFICALFALALCSAHRLAATARRGLRRAAAARRHAGRHRRRRPQPTVPGVEAQVVDGLAAAPPSAPHAVKHAIWAANPSSAALPSTAAATTRASSGRGYDCSGTVSFALHGGNLLTAPLDSSSFMRWGAAGEGDWITVYTNPGHAFAVIAGCAWTRAPPATRAAQGPALAPEPALHARLQGAPPGRPVSAGERSGRAEQARSAEPARPDRPARPSPLGRAASPDPPGTAGRRQTAGSGGSGARPGLVEQDPLGAPVERVRLLGRVADRGQPDPAELGQRADHVEDDAGLARLVEVQAGAGDEVEQVVDREPAQRSVTRGGRSPRGASRARSAVRNSPVAGS